MKITTNKIARQLLPLCDLPKKAQSDFDYISEESHYENRLVQYKGNWYDVYDTQRIQVTNVTGNTSSMGSSIVVYPEDDFAKWDSIVTESFFSGVVFKLAPDDCVICGRYST